MANQYHDDTMRTLAFIGCKLPVNKYLIHCDHFYRCEVQKEGPRWVRQPIEELKITDGLQKEIAKVMNELVHHSSDYEGWEISVFEMPEKKVAGIMLYKQGVDVIPMFKPGRRA